MYSVLHLQWIFTAQELDWGLLNCRWILYQQSYQGSPVSSLCVSNFLEEIFSIFHSIVFLYFFALITEGGQVIIDHLEGGNEVALNYLPQTPKAHIHAIHLETPNLCV